MDQLKEKILELNIVDVISRYVDLKKAGINYKGHSPFTQEKTPSFFVNPAKQIFKCFSSGIGGNAITFIMEHEKLGFREALKKIARDHNIQYQEKEYTKEEKQADHKREQMEIVNALAVEYFCNNLTGDALKYAQGRWTEETIKWWAIGYAPDEWHGLQNFMEKKGVKIDILIEAGLLKENKDKNIYDTFRGRIMFPIQNKYSRIVGFTGRSLTGNDAKYLNTAENILFRKGEILFGLDKAYKSIREKGFAYLVEGQPDVIKLHQIDIHNTVCTGGTSLTEDHIRILKGLCKSVNIVPDTDGPGMLAMQRSAQLLIKAEMQVNILPLPDKDDGGKHDADSFFTDNKQFKEHATKNIIDFIFYRAEQLTDDFLKNPDIKINVINYISDLLICFPDPILQEMYVNRLGEMMPPKKTWKDKLKLLQKEQGKVEKKEIVPGHVDANDFERYGFYEDHNSYHFRKGNSILRGTNFRMKPLFHIQSVLNAKRLYEIENEYGIKEVIELAQKDLVSLQAFRLRVESLGNFLFEASEVELNKLKRFLYEKTETCLEITQLGWQKYNFFAWANGIYNGTFTKVDEFGIVKHEDVNYYLPAFSKIFRHEDGLFLSERRFIHREGNSISLHNYSQQLIDVFGDNAIIAICFYFASLFRDIVVAVTNSFPILNLFGPKGAGKTELAVSLLQFFGRQSKGPNINNTTKPALADHVAQVSNALSHIDEYKNNIEFEKIEFLKGLWDGTGRTRMNMDKDKKKETTAVDCAVMLSGQEMPTADIAFFSRLIYLTFTKTEYTEKEKEDFNNLKEVEKKGLTHITHTLLQLREKVKKEYRNSYDAVSNEILKLFGKEVIEDRIFRNWTMVLGVYRCIKDEIGVPFTYDQVISLSVDLIRRQNRETKKNNEISVFWSMVEYLASDGLIQQEVDFKLETTMDFKTDIIHQKWTEPKNILLIQYSRVFTLYRKHGKAAGEKILPIESIDYYLRNDRRYLGKKKTAFKVFDARTGRQMEEEVTENHGFGTEIHTYRKRNVTSAYCFLYDELNISIINDNEEGPEMKQKGIDFSNRKEEDIIDKPPF